MEKQQITITVPRVNLHSAWRFAQKWLLPNPGTLVLMLVLLTVFPGLAAPFNGINAASISTIPYQGRLADASGSPVTGKQNMEFRIYDVPAGGAPLWEEFWTGANSVDVSDGLFSVMLGSINTGLTAVVQGNNNLYLGITVGTDTEMTPRVQLGSVPFSIWSLTVADSSITTAKIADGAVITSKLADDAITSAKIAEGAVGNSEIASDAIPVFSASTTEVDWTVTSCDENQYTVPGLTLNINNARAGNLVIDFTGLGYSSLAGSALYSIIYVDNQPLKATSGTNLWGGCRNGPAGSTYGNEPWCSLANSAAHTLSAGNHIVEIRVFCDESAMAQVHVGFLRAMIIP